MDTIILLTTTIDNRKCYQPNDERQHYCYDRDLSNRISYYIQSLKQWLQTNYKVVIIENSQHPLIYEIIDLLNIEKNVKPINYSNKERKHYLYGNIEFLSYDGNYESYLYGKGHGEKKSILYASRHSKLINNIDENTHIVCKYMSSLNVDTRVWGFSQIFLEELQKQEINDKKVLSMELSVGLIINKMENKYINF